MRAADLRFVCNMEEETFAVRPDCDRLSGEVDRLHFAVESMEWARGTGGSRREAKSKKAQDKSGKNNPRAHPSSFEKAERAKQT
jgi:hypothetical protein